MEEKKISVQVISLFSLLFVLMIVFISVRGREEKKPAYVAEAVARPAPEIVLPPAPAFSAHAYVVRMVGEKKPFLEQRIWKPLPPASLTKLLTVLVARERIPENEWISVSGEARQIEEKRSKATAGEGFSRDDLVRLALIYSANDAASALAEAVGAREGGVSFDDRMSRFLIRMNEKARAAGMIHSQFENASGLDGDGHFATAEDLALLVEYIWQHDRSLWDITRTYEISLLSDRGTTHTIQNTNDLLQEFPELRGGKTGFTDRARGALILLYPVGTQDTAIVVLLGSEDRFGDGRKAIQWLKDYTHAREIAK